jgi:hypothetical protein
MDAFQILSRGGAKFNKARFRHDVQLFKVSRYPKLLLLALKEQRGFLARRATFPLQYKMVLFRQSSIFFAMPNVPGNGNQTIQMIPSAQKDSGK